MRFIHLADLHIGKKLKEISLLNDQHAVLKQVLAVAEEYDVDGILLAGDIYDKASPSGEAVQLLDWFLTQVAGKGIPVYMVPGNHDSAERISFGAKLLAKSRVYVSPVYDGRMEPVVLQDEYGPLNIYLLPFVKPVHVKKALDKPDIFSYQEAVKAAIEAAGVRENERNILVAHQLVTGASRCDSEEISIGGMDNVDAEVFDAFDYVALGHIHGPQSIVRDTVRYAGTLLKYSLSECGHDKSITVVELREKGNVTIETVPVKPLHDLRKVRGTYEQLMSYDFYKDSDQNDYLGIVLTDEEEIPDVLGKLRTVYSNILQLEYDNMKTRQSGQLTPQEKGKDKEPLEYVEELFEVQNNQSMTDGQRALVVDIMKKVWG